jgi:hypothetical protein
MRCDARCRTSDGVLVAFALTASPNPAAEAGDAIDSTPAAATAATSGNIERR